MYNLFVGGPTGCECSGKIGRSSLAHAGGSGFQCGSAWRSFNGPGIGIRKTNEHLAIQIQDDGHGITGAACKHDHKEPADAALGPVSLRGRVVELGGSLDVRSSALGTELQIRMPLA